jgi:hypothetical protein
MNTDIIKAVRTVGMAKPAKAVYAHDAMIDAKAQACIRVKRIPHAGISQ